MKILITGIAGLIGANFSKYLLNKGYEVIGIDNLTGGYREYVDSRVKFYCFDLLDNFKLKQVFDDCKPEVVYHFAAYAAEGLSPFIRNFNYTNNVITSINVINECIKNNTKIIFTSSMAVYGEIPTPFKETDLPKPEDPYGIAKLTVEMDLALANKQFGLQYNIVRPHNIIGIYQNIWDRYRNVIGIWINNCLNNKSLLIYGDGKQKRAFSDVEYYMSPFEMIGNNDNFNNQIFNIGADKEYELIEVCKLVQKVANKNGYFVDINFVESRHEVKNAFCNHDKAKSLLNFKDKTDIEKVINDMFKWAINEPKRSQKIMKYEIEKNIYSYWRS